MRSTRLHIAVALLALLLAQTGALAEITVVVNGRTLPSYPPGIQRSGRTLLPMRTVFEALGAEVKWEAVTQTAMGVRGPVTVRMSINQNTAFINQRPVTLDVPPLLIGGSTYMPVRFPAEAFGADVLWEGAIQRVTITLPPLGATQPITPPEPTPIQPTPPSPPEPEPLPEPAPVPQPEPAARPQPGTVTGLVSAARGARVALQIDQELQVYNVTADSILLRQGRQVAVEDLRVGDLAEVRHDGIGNAIVVRASYDTLEGIVLAKVPNQLLVDSRAQPLQIQPEVEVTTSTGEAAPYADIATQDRVSLRLTPNTNNVYGIIVQRPEPTPDRPTEQPPSQPPPRRGVVEIDQFYHNAEKPLKAGDLIRVTLEGTARGTAWFDIGDVAQRLELDEANRRPGRYDAEYRIPEGMNALGVPLIGYLEVEGRAADPAQSSDAITIDTIPPQVTIFGPGQDERTSNRQPNIALLIADENGVGLDYDRSTVACRVNDGDHPLQLTRQGQLLSAVPDPLPDGTVRILVQAYDKAGNKTEDMRRFIVGSAQPGAETLSVSHDAAGVLIPGEVLTVTATGPARGQATFDIGNWRRDQRMTEVLGELGTYRGTFRVPELWWDREEPVIAHLIAQGRQALAAQATTPVRMGPQRQLEPRIVSPVADANVGQEVVVEGHTQPHSEVAIVITWSGRTLFMEQTGQVTELQVTADQTGHFKTDPISLRVQSLFPVKNVRYTLTCVVANPRGEESEPVTVEFLP
jgi:hypothetical protein